ncbi:MAG: NAD(P)/FAD-dependent oxidoreductase [Albidovulum sp.]
MKTDVLIIGGGLAGLGLARGLHAAGQEFLLLESRSRFGGRIKTENLKGGYYDMGPAWFWPGQPRMEALTNRLGLVRFDQHDMGDVIFEDEAGQVQRGRGYASMQGSYRLQGGMGVLTDALADALPNERKRLGVAVATLKKTDAGVVAVCRNGETIVAQRVVLALPPRLAAEQISFRPALPTGAAQAMRGIATWMAGQAKCVAVYDTPFWRQAGLSGDAMSRRGPMVEIHDASPAVGGPYALFGFVGVPPQSRKDAALLRDQSQRQLVRLFGPKAAHPCALFIKDWAFDPNTATSLDRAPVYAHPQYGLPHAMHDLWDGALLFGGSEVAVQFGGYLEGALEAAANALQTLRN